MPIKGRRDASAYAFTYGPPFAIGDAADIAGILGHNLLVLALHAMACVAGFIVGSSLPLQANSHRGVSHWVHEHGGRIAIGFVVCATTFSLSAQAYLLGDRLAAFAHFLGVPAALLMLAVLPHAVPELVALFLPLAAWIMASRRGRVGPVARRDARDGRRGDTRTLGSRARGGLCLTPPLSRACRSTPPRHASARGMTTSPPRRRTARPWQDARQRVDEPRACPPFHLRGLRRGPFQAHGDDSVDVSSE